MTRWQGAERASKPRNHRLAGPVPTSPLLGGSSRGKAVPSYLCVDLSPRECGRREASPPARLGPILWPLGTTLWQTWSPADQQQSLLPGEAFLLEPRRGGQLLGFLPQDLNT